MWLDSCQIIWYTWPHVIGNKSEIMIAPSKARFYRITPLLLRKFKFNPKSIKMFTFLYNVSILAGLVCKRG